MTAPSLPSGYDETRHVRAGRSDCHITVGFDQSTRQIPRFLVQLHYQIETTPVEWSSIARMDHNETAATGHNVYNEGLHVDLHRQSDPTVHLDIRHGQLSRNRGRLIRGCVDDFSTNTAYFIGVYEGDRPPGRPPRWSDGGSPTHRLNRTNAVERNMSQESSAEEPLTPEELSEELAAATGSSTEEIERGFEGMDVQPPWDAEITTE